MVEWCHKFLNDFKSVNQSIPMPINLSDKKWKSPGVGSSKINVNGAVKYKRDGTGIRVVVRDATGNVAASNKIFNAS